MIRIMLVDDHELVRTGFRLILSKQADMEIVAEAADAEEAIVAAKRLKPDVVLMDLHLPGLSGLEATERLVRHDHNIRVIVVTAQGERPFPRRLLEMGAMGYLTKACPASELVSAIRSVYRGERALSSDVAQAMALELVHNPGNRSPFEALSARELEVALKLAAGQSMPEIAKRLNLSSKTVATYKYRLYDKLSVRNEIALAHLAAQHGLLAQNAL